jgi:hypothetical protein
MYTVVVASGLLVFVLLITMRLNRGRSCSETRNILLHVPLATAWERVRDFGALQMSHGRGRPLLHTDSSELVRGDGLTPGSVWRQRGRWGVRPWWAEIGLVLIDPPHRLEVSLLRDVFSTRSGLAYHRCIVDLREAGPHATRLRFRLRARTRGARLTLARTFSRARVSARLLDLGLRSLKSDMDRGLRCAAGTEGVARASEPTTHHRAGPRLAGLAASSSGAPPQSPASHERA